jgi:lysyl-tRNA synthetase class 2
MSSLSNWKKLYLGKMKWNVFFLRDQILQSIRSYFNSNHFLEVDPPYLTPYPTLDVNIQSMETIYIDESNKSIMLFLHTSPEHSMKKLLAAGMDRIYFLGKVFRNRERTSMHNPEFTMCEWYRKNSTYLHLQYDAQELILRILEKLQYSHSCEYQGQKIDFSLPWNCITVKTLFKNETGLDIDKDASLGALQEVLVASGMHFQKTDDWDTLFFRIFIEQIEPKLGFPKPTFVMDYPLSLGLMAKTKEDDPNWVERVELYIAGLEIANGYSELLDPQELEKRFLADRKKKQRETNKTYPVDTELLSAMEAEIPPSAGMAMGIDRLIMLLTNTKDIQDVLFFPIHQWL